MAFVRVKFTSQKTRCICISVTDQSVSSREVVSSIDVGRCKKQNMLCGNSEEFLMLYQVVGTVIRVLETLILLFHFCSDHLYVVLSH